MARNVGKKPVKVPKTKASTRKEPPTTTANKNDHLKYRYGVEILFYAGFLMWVLYLYGLEIVLLFNDFNMFQLVKVIFLMIGLRYLFIPCYVLGSKFMEVTGAVKLAEAYRNEIKKSWTV